MTAVTSNANRMNRLPGWAIIAAPVHTPTATPDVQRALKGLAERSRTAATTIRRYAAGSSLGQVKKLFSKTKPDPDITAIARSFTIWGRPSMLSRTHTPMTHRTWAHNEKSWYCK